MKKENFSIGDMPVEEFRKYGYEIVDWVADYFKNIENYPVFPDIKPGDIIKNIPANPPETGEKFENIFNDFDKKILPGITHWNHPGFMAYFNSTSSSPGILAEILSAALNANGMIWKTSPSVSELERAVLNWFKKMLQLPEKFWGIIYDTASVSSMHAIAAAREQINLNIKEKGMAGRKDIPRLRLYCSEQAHSSIEKGALTLGIGLEGVKKIPVNNNFEMLPDEFEKAVNDDIKQGWLPFCAVATVGTTSTTSIDPVKKIAEICRKNNIWLHVDAAHAGIAALVPEVRYILDGIENADSMVVNPHKWMFTPVDLSVLFTKKPEVLKQAFSLIPEYLKTKEDDAAENLMDYGVQLGRRFRALKLWFIIRYFGTEGIIKRVREHLRLGKILSELMEENPEFEKSAPVKFSTVCFRAVPKNFNESETNIFNEKLLNLINAKGKIFLSHTKLNGKFIIRISVSGIRSEEKHVREAWKIIKSSFDELKNKYKSE